MNTRFTYMYRDAANWKAHKTLTFTGEPTPALIARLTATLDNGEQFIPNDLPHPICDLIEPLQWRLGGPDEDSHCWHEIDVEVDIKPTSDSAPAYVPSLPDVVAAFEAAAAAGWPTQDSDAYLVL